MRIDCLKSASPKLIGWSGLTRAPAHTAQTKGKTYSEEEDRFMLVRLDHHGYTTEGAYELIKKDILNWDGFRFDW